MHTEDGEENVAVGGEGHQQTSSDIHTSKNGQDTFIQVCVRTGELKKWGAITEEVMNDNGTAEMKAADIIKDDVINTKDAIKLAQYLAKWDVTLE